MKILLGIVLVLAGFLVTLFGDRGITNKGGIVLRTFSQSKFHTKILKFAMGIILIILGIGIVFEAM